MNFIHELALLFESLLFPGKRSLPAAQIPEEVAAIIADYRISSLPAAANDAGEREAA